jgi:predicted MFS family arabinose efflux permease
MVEELGYASTFCLLAGIGALATALVVVFIPETVTGHAANHNPSEVAFGSSLASQEEVLP